VTPQKSKHPVLVIRRKEHLAYGRFELIFQQPQDLRHI
jgi:hypothetical protein